MLKWARENGCEWDEETCEAAGYRKHWDVLQWLTENGCPGAHDSARHWQNRWRHEDKFPDKFP